MERQVDISFAHNGGSAVLLSSNTYGRFGRIAASKPKGRFFWFLISKGWQKTRPKINQKNRPFGLRVKPRNRRLSGRIFCCGNDDKRLLG